MAIAGSEDMLTRIITRFMAQGYRPKYAAIFKFELHDKTANIDV